MGHLTYEEQYVVAQYMGKNDTYKPIYMEKCHPDFCQICFNKMYQVEVGGGATELKTDLINFTEEGPKPHEVENRIYEPDGYGGCHKVDSCG